MLNSSTYKKLRAIIQLIKVFDSKRFYNANLQPLIPRYMSPR